MRLLPLFLSLVGHPRQASVAPRLTLRLRRAGSPPAPALPCPGLPLHSALMRPLQTGDHHLHATTVCCIGGLPPWPPCCACSGGSVAGGILLGATAGCLRFHSPWASGPPQEHSGVLGGAPGAFPLTASPSACPSWR